MKVSRRWLEAFLDQPLDTEDLVPRLAMLGLPPDAVEPLHAALAAEITPLRRWLDHEPYVTVG